MTWQQIRDWIDSLSDEDLQQEAEVLITKDRNGYNGEFLKIRGNCVNYDPDDIENRPYLTVGGE